MFIVLNARMAKVKKIAIETEFEPLFPIKIDPELIKQVFSNLIENAIKYSPKAAPIHVSLQEQNKKARKKNRRRI